MTGTTQVVNQKYILLQRGCPKKAASFLINNLPMEKAKRLVTGNVITTVISLVCRAKA